MIIIDKNAKREVQVKYPDRTRVLFPNLDDGYISSNDVVIPGVNAPISGDGVGVASINDGAEGNAISKLVISIDPVQDLHGQSNPYPAGGGKNLLNPSIFETKTSGNITYTPKTDTVVSLSGTSDSTTNYYICPTGSNVVKENCGYVLPAGTYTFSARKKDGTALGLDGAIGLFYWEGDSETREVVQANNSNTISVTVTSDETLYVTPIIGGASGKATNFDVYFQLEVGNTATAWSPYSNICPISGWTEAKVTRTGKNLLNPDILTTMGTTYVTSVNYNTEGKISVKPSTQYVFSFSGTVGDGRIFQYDASGNAIGSALQFTSQPYSFTTDARCTKIGFRYKFTETSGATVADSKAQLEKGSTSTAYEAYNGQQYTISLDGTIYGGTLDVTTGVLTVDRAVATLNGSESWSTNSATTGLYYLTISGIKNATGHIKSNMFKETTVSGVNMVVGEMKFVSPNIVNFKTSYATVDAWKTALASDNVQLLYELNTPFTVQLTAEEVTTLKGQNNIWADCGNVLELSYSANMNIRLQDLLDEKLDKPTTPGTLGQVLTSDGEGGQTWETPE